MKVYTELTLSIQLFVISSFGIADEIIKRAIPTIIKKIFIIKSIFSLILSSRRGTLHEKRIIQRDSVKTKELTVRNQLFGKQIERIKKLKPIIAGKIISIGYIFFLFISSPKAKVNLIRGFQGLRQ